MGLFERLIGRLAEGEARIPVMSFGSAMRELIRGKLTPAQLHAMFGMSASEQSELSTLIGWAQTLANAAAREQLASVIEDIAGIGELLVNDGVVMTGNPQITIANVEAGPDTITRSAGSFAADGFAAGQSFRLVTVPGASGPNNGIYRIAGGTTTRIDVTGDLLTNEVVASGAVLERVLYGTGPEATARVIVAVNELGGTAP